MPDPDRIARYALSASAMVVSWGMPSAGSGKPETTGLTPVSLHEPARSHSAAIVFASDHATAAVFFRRKRSPNVPDAYIGQAHFRHPRRSSSGSYVLSWRARPPAQWEPWRR